MIGVQIKFKRGNVERNPRFNFVSNYTIIEDEYILIIRDTGNVTIDISDSSYVYVDTYNLKTLIKDRVYSFNRIEHRNSIIDTLLS